jgi:hypothetical protein
MSDQIEPITYRPNVPARYDSAKGVAQRSANEIGGPKGVAFRLGLKRSRVHQLLAATEPSQMLHAQVRELVKAGARAPVEDLCALAGGAFLPGDAPISSLSQLTSTSLVEHSHFVSCVLLALADGHLSADERCAILRAIDDAVRALIGARQLVEQQDVPA